MAFTNSKVIRWDMRKIRVVVQIVEWDFSYVSPENWWSIYKLAGDQSFRRTKFQNIKQTATGHAFGVRWSSLILSSFKTDGISVVFSAFQLSCWLCHCLFPVYLVLHMWSHVNQRTILHWQKHPRNSALHLAGSDRWLAKSR